MSRSVLISVMMVFASWALSSEHQKINTLGISSKGQYVAIEEYGYQSLDHSYYAKIKIMNVWKEEYVGDEIVVTLPAYKAHNLDQVREKARLLSQDQLKKFNINGQRPISLI